MHTRELKYLEKVNGDDDAVNTEKLDKTDTSAENVEDGKVVDKHSRNILSYGDIIRTGTLKKLSEIFKIKKHLTVIRVWK